MFKQLSFLRFKHLLTHPRQWRAALSQRPTLMLLSANLFAQGLALALAPVLTRLYTPQDFGILGALSALVLICVPLATGRYELALPSARTEREVLAILNVCIVSIVAMTALCTVTAFIVAKYFEAGTLTEYWYFVPIALACVALYDTLAMEASRRRTLETLAASKITQSLSGIGSQITLGFLAWGSVGLLIGFVISQAMGVLGLFKQQVLGHPARGEVSWREVRHAAYQHRRFPFYSSGASFLDASSKWGVQLAISVFWSPVIGGYIFLADRIIGRPLMLTSTAFLPVYVADVSECLRQSPERIPQVFYSTLWRQALVAVVWTGLAVLLAPWVIVPLFGARWADAVPFVQIMSIAIAPGAIMHAVAHTLMMAGRQRLDLILIIAKVSSTLSVLVVGYIRDWSALTTLTGFAFVQMGFALVSFFLYRSVVDDLARRAPTSSVATHEHL